MSHSKVVAATSPRASRQRMMWPKSLSGRGLAASTGGFALAAVVVPSALLLETGVLPRRLLFVRVK
jgi:hypothetical protein